MNPLRTRGPWKRLFRAGSILFWGPMLLLAALVPAISHAQTALFWTNPESASKLARSPLDLPAAETVLFGMERPLGMDYDPVEDRIYWVDYDLAALMRANADGSGVETIMTGLRADIRRA